MTPEATWTCEGPIRIEDLMAESGVKFGTSGARGLAADMTDAVCYAYTLGFIQYLEEIGQLALPGRIALGGDFRASTDRIMGAAARAIADRGYEPVNCGKLPTPALAFYGLAHQIPTVMVTGSHIPEDRNGIKYTRKDGEILKPDEAGIRRQRIRLPAGLCNAQGMFMESPSLPHVSSEATDRYIERYLSFFGRGCLKGRKIGVYQHSAVGRDLLVTIFSGLGAQVTPLGRSETFVPVDTEAIRPEDIEAARRWTDEQQLDAIVSTDGDSDRPLIGDETGKWMRGDVAGILCAAYLKADAVATPVSCNSALEKCGWFQAIRRTRIGSPYVIEGMQQFLAEGAGRVVGYEANGGFLLASDIPADGSVLGALPTRDAVILLIAVLLLAAERRKTLSALVMDLPPRFTFSNRLKNFPTQKSRAQIQAFQTGQAATDHARIEKVFGIHFGRVAHIDTTDGLRITFDNAEVVHLRPSGNAPEFRCYTEAATESRAAEMNARCLEIMEGWR